MKFVTCDWGLSLSAFCSSDQLLIKRFRKAEVLLTEQSVASQTKIFSLWDLYFLSKHERFHHRQELMCSIKSNSNYSRFSSLLTWRWRQQISTKPWYLCAKVHGITFQMTVTSKMTCIPIHWCRSQWPRGLRHELSSLARILGSWVRISLGAWMSFCVYSVFMLGNGLATGWSLV
jgi:hypothetical protein